MLKSLVCALGMAATSLCPLPAQTPAQSIKGNFDGVHRRLLEMAKDFPADKYGFRLKPEMRSFGEVLVHLTSGVVYAAKAGRGEKANWDELNPKDYPNKAAVVALMEKSIADADKSMNALPAEAFTKSVEPWVDVLEHSAEHYGLLVAYYRANGIVPPESRPKKK
jgi:hypothetical protein